MNQKERSSNKGTKVASEADPGFFAWLSGLALAMLGWIMSGFSSKTKTLDAKVSASEVDVAVLKSEIKDLKEDVQVVTRKLDELHNLIYKWLSEQK